MEEAKDDFHQKHLNNDQQTSPSNGDELKRVNSSPSLMLGMTGSCGLIENYDYTKNIKMFLEMEKLRLISVA
jgi:hypothetical protein